MDGRWIAALAAASMLGGITGGAAAEAETFGVLLKNIRNPFWAAAEEGAKDAAAELDDVEVYVVAAESDAQVEPQLNICNTMLERDTDALIVAAVNPTGLLPCLTQATEGGITVVDIDANLVKEVAQEAGAEVAFSVGSDNKEAGALGAEYIAERLQEGKVLLLEGAPGALTAIDRRDGFAQHLPKLGPSLEIVASLTGNWERGRAANVTTDVLTRHPDLAAIFASNDQMALGAAEAARAAGRDDLLIVGVDGNPDAVEAIKQGRLTASVAQLPYLMGYEGVKKTKALMDGETIEPWKQVTPLIVLDKETLDAGTDPLLRYVR
jgi:D-allose transport system substrate-binding protein